MIRKCSHLFYLKEELRVLSTLKEKNPVKEKEIVSLPRLYGNNEVRNRFLYRLVG